jgi:archaellum component FlaC
LVGDTASFEYGGDVMAEETGSFRVTMRHVWEEQQEMKRLLQKVSDQLPTVADKLAIHEKETGEILKDHENRLRSVEQRLWKVFGAIAIIAGAAPFIARML